MKTVTAPNTVSMLNDPNIFIGDFGASTHSTLGGEGLINMKRGEANDVVIV